MRFAVLSLLAGCASAPEAEDQGDADSGAPAAGVVAASGGDSPSAQYGLALASLDDEDEDGRWEVGESAMLFVALTNQGEDDFDYPECILRSEDLASGPGEWTLFGVAAGQTEQCSFALEHLAALSAGDEVAMEVVAHRLNCEGDCPEENPLSLSVVLAEPD